jgi:bifunctional non-homologous end joining protein LigD
MTLDKYNQKRNFNFTEEPKGENVKSKNDLIFVVQNHAASHLHYDFRIEMNGVLKSWAIPKGPSMNPNDKRFAIMVEDHPFSYKDFEGTIPEGNYGAGNVIVWDNGTYTLPEEYSKAATENKLKTDLEKGHIRFILNGKKIKGEFSLVKLNNEEDNSWLLIKKNDSYATDADILKKDKSLLSKVTIEDLAKSFAKFILNSPTICLKKFFLHFSYFPPQIHQYLFQTFRTQIIWFKFFGSKTAGKFPNFKNFGSLDFIRFIIGIV